MKIYIGSRFTRKEEVRAAYKKLQEAGHTISYDWTLHKDMTPYAENQEIATDYAKKDIDGVINSDIFIALCDKTQGSTGMHTEIGVAIASKIKSGKPDIFIIGEENKKAMFYFHPEVKRIKSIEEFLAKIKEA